MITDKKDFEKAMNYWVVKKRKLLKLMVGNTLLIAPLMFYYAIFVVKEDFVPSFVAKLFFYSSFILGVLMLVSHIQLEQERQHLISLSYLDIVEKPKDRWGREIN